MKRPRIVTTGEGCFVNIEDIKDALNDDAFVNDVIVPLLKVGHERGDSITQIARVIAMAPIRILVIEGS